MQPLKISIALSGGGALGLAHIAAVQAFEDLGLTPYAISGTSMGSIIGAAWASGMDSYEMLQFCQEQLADRPHMMANLLKLKTKQSLNLLQGGNFAQFDAADVVEMFLPAPFPTHFDTLNIPLCVVATDFYAWKEVWFKAGNLTCAIACSIAIPAVFSPVYVDGRYLVDGGCVNPMPFDALPEESDLIVAVDVLGGPRKKSPTDAPNTRDVLIGGAHILMQSIINEKLKRRAPDLLAYPELSDFLALEFHKCDAILKHSQSMREKLKYSLERKINAMTQ